MNPLSEAREKDLRWHFVISGPRYELSSENDIFATIFFKGTLWNTQTIFESSEGKWILRQRGIPDFFLSRFSILSFDNNNEVARFKGKRLRFSDGEEFVFGSISLFRIELVIAKNDGTRVIHMKSSLARLSPFFKIENVIVSPFKLSVLIFAGFWVYLNRDKPLSH